MFIQSTMQFQQATQSILQANTQAIEKLKVGQLTTLIYEDNEEEISNQPIADPIGQLEIEVSSYNEQADPITTLGNNQIIDIHKCEPLEVDIMDDDDDSSIQMSDNLVSDFIVLSSSIDPLEECLAQCDLDFDDDA